MPFTRLIDYFEAQASLCSSEAELLKLVENSALELGFDYFALLHHASLETGGRNFIRIDTYPQGWEDAFKRAGLLGQDPVHLASERTNIGFAWRELAQLVPLGPRQKEMLERARCFDIGDGFTVPVNVPGEPAGSCTFAVRTGAMLPIERLRCAEQVGAHAFRAARRIAGYPAAARRPHLSRRERQCVRLVAAGKTDWEIAAILGISVDTAHQYVKRARAAYDVVSRAQLAACALRDSLVSFAEAIPQDG